MRRTDVYLKVELVLDEKESAERVAAEICRQVRKLHGVRQAKCQQAWIASDRCATSNPSVVKRQVIDLPTL